MKPHPLDALSLVFGVIFAGIGILYLTGNEVGDLVSQFWPGAVVLLGLAMLFSARRPDPEADAASPARWPDPVPGVRGSETTTPLDRTETRSEGSDL
jgi:hypothetical protein